MRILWLIILVASCSFAHAAIPLTINHQGFVTVNGTPFTGTGRFWFGFYDGSTNKWLWTNDGTISAGTDITTPPTNHVEVTVTDGQYSVALGNIGTNMVAVPSSVFESDLVLLRTYFDDGVGGASEDKVFMGDQRITSSAYAYHAATADVAAVALEAQRLQLGTTNFDTTAKLAVSHIDTTAAYDTLTFDLGDRVEASVSVDGTRPVLITFQTFKASHTGGSNSEVTIRREDDDDVQATYSVSSYSLSGDSNKPMSLAVIDTPSAGNYTYYIVTRAFGGSTIELSGNDTVLSVIELNH